MASIIEGLAIELSLDTSKVEKELSKMGDVAKAAAGELNKAFEKSKGETRELSKEMSVASKSIKRNMQSAAASTASAYKTATDTTKRNIKSIAKESANTRRKVQSDMQQMSKKPSVNKPSGSGSSGGSSGGMMGFASRAALPVAAAAVAMKVVIAYAKATDEILMFRGQLSALLDDAEQIPIIEKNLIAMSTVAGQSVGESMKLFSRIVLVKNDLNATSKEVLKFVENVQKIAVATGSVGESFRFGSTQLAQGLTSGVLRAEELNSMLENMPGVAKELAKQLGYGGMTGKLRMAVLEGKVLSKDVFKALAKDITSVNKNIDKIPMTWNRAFAQAGNAAMAMASKIEDSTGISEFLANDLADTFKGAAYAMGAMNRPLSELNERMEKYKQQLFEVAAQDKDSGPIGKYNMILFIRREMAKTEKEMKKIQEEQNKLLDEQRAKSLVNTTFKEDLLIQKAINKAKMTQVKHSKEIRDIEKSAVAAGLMQAELALSGEKLTGFKLEMVKKIVAAQKESNKLAEKEQQIKKSQQRVEKIDSKIAKDKYKLLELTKQLSPVRKALVDMGALDVQQAVSQVALSAELQALYEKHLPTLEAIKKAKESDKEDKKYQSVMAKHNQALAKLRSLTGEMSKERQNLLSLGEIDLKQALYKTDLTEKQMAIAKNYQEVLDKTTEAEKAAAKRKADEVAGQQRKVNLAKFLQGIEVDSLSLQMNKNSLLAQAVKYGLFTAEYATKIKNMTEGEVKALKSKMDVMGKIEQKQKEERQRLSDKSSAENIINSLMTPDEKTEQGMAEFNRLYEDVIAAAVEAGVSTTNIQEKYQDHLKKTNKLQEKNLTLSQLYAKEMVDSIEDVIFSGKSLGDMFNDITMQIIKMTFRAKILQPIMDGILGGGSSKGKGGGSFFGNLGKLFGFAGGGRMNGPSIVGERGPEIITPDSPMTVMNNAATRRALNGGGGGGVNQTIVFEATVQKDMYAAIMQAMPAIVGATEQAMSNKQRGINI